MAEFVHLHVHTQFSLLDGMGKIEDYLTQAAGFGMDALAVTDHGVMYAVPDFYLAARKAGIKPVLGCEAYIAPRSMFDRTPRQEGGPYHLTLLAEDMRGYRALTYLTTRAHVDGFYYKPRVDRDLLAEHHQGLIALSGCASGQVARCILKDDLDGAAQVAGELNEIFGQGNFYLEMMDHGLADQERINRGLASVAHKLGLPLVASNDVHYVRQADAAAHEVLLCIQTNTSIEDSKRMRLDTDKFYLRSPEEMAQLFAEVPAALSNTVEIAGRCQVSLEQREFSLPNFPLPEGCAEDEYLEKLCAEGVRRRYPEVTAEIRERLAYELSIIERMKFAPYFLVVADFVAFARSKGILVGPGRGSAAGSIVTYVLGITDIDPLKHQLIFERFLNPGRITMPDIDMDFADDRRDEVIKYVTEKYGADHVAQIVTFGTMAARAAVRDVGRALGLPYGTVDRVAKLIPATTQKTTDGSGIAAALASVPDLRALAEQDESVAKLLDTAQRLEGVARHSSTHAAGVVISREPLVNLVPLQRTAGGELVVQYHMGALENVGLLKMDFLGLSTLTIIGRALQEVARTTGKAMTIDEIPLGDPAIYELLCRGETFGIFQLEGDSTRRMTVDVKPTCFDDVVALMALIRPGPMTMAPLFIQRKSGQSPIEYLHPELEPILKDTYGIMLYQEQIMKIANVLAGFSMSEADYLRKAMGKKLVEEMRKQRKRFISGAKQHGVRTAVAEELFDQMDRFAGYGFNRSHAAAYAVIACQTAYLKATYPVEYMAALLTSEMGNPEKVAAAVAECRRAGINVLPPDVNRSQARFSVETGPDGKGIRLGIAAVKNIGLAAAECLVEERERGGSFDHLTALTMRLDLRQLNKRVLESLIKCGAMDCLGERAQQLAGLDQAIAAAQRRQKDQQAGLVNLFEAKGVPVDMVAGPRADVAPTPRRERLLWEKELLGFYVSEHPLQHLAHVLRFQDVTPSVNLSPELEGQRVKMIGVLSSVRRILTRKQQSMLVAQLDDLHGSVEVVVFPRTLERTAEVWQEDAIVAVEGKVDTSRDDRPKLLCDAAAPFQRAEKRRVKEGTIRIGSSGDLEADVRRMQEINHILSYHGGSERTFVVIANGNGDVRMELPQCVEWTEGLVAELGSLLGAEVITVAEVDA